jgi:Spy/CpxP family protein refolding chaperone
MKTVFAAVLVFVSLSFFVVSGSQAQMCGKMGPMGCGMMGGGMGEGMMGGGMMGYGMMQGMGRHGMECGMMGSMPHCMMMNLANLNLDDTQKAEMKEIKMKAMKDMIKKRADMQVAMIELGDFLDKEPVDMKAVEAKMKELEAMRTAMHLEMIRTRELIKSKLTPEQRKKFNDMMSGGPMCGMGMMHDDMEELFSPAGEEGKGEMEPSMEHEHMSH